jgi:hypothetical protein
MIETNRFHLQKTGVKKKELGMKKGVKKIVRLPKKGVIRAEHTYYVRQWECPPWRNR